METEDRHPREVQAEPAHTVSGLVRFVDLQLEEILARHRIFIGPEARADLRLLQQALAELSPRAEVIHVAWSPAPAEVRKAA